VNRYGTIEAFPPETLGANREMALLFKTLATLRTDAPLFTDVDELRWTRATPAFPAVAEKLGEARLLTRVQELEKKLDTQTVGEKSQ
jgi:hypothetical protein